MCLQKNASGFQDFAVRRIKHAFYGRREIEIAEQGLFDQKSYKCRQEKEFFSGNTTMNRVSNELGLFFYSKSVSEICKFMLLHF